MYIIPNLPPDLKARLFAAFDLAILWNKDKARATVTVTITDATLAALPEILNPAQPGYHDTAAAEPETVGALACPPIAGPLPHPSGSSAPGASLRRAAGIPGRRSRFRYMQTHTTE
jgi:hypothetical protein